MLRTIIAEVVDFLGLLTVLFIFAVGLISVVDAALDRHFWPALGRIARGVARSWPFRSRKLTAES